MKFFLFLQVLLKLWWRPLCRLFSVYLNRHLKKEYSDENNIFFLVLSIFVFSIQY